MAGLTAVLLAASWNGTPIIATGDLDPSFGTNGVVITQFSGTGAAGSAAAGIAVQSDGKIVVVGSTQPSGSYDFALARYNADGSLDASFGGTGTITTDLAYGGPGSDDHAYAVAIDANGKILVAGSTRGTGVISERGHDFALVRYNTDGSIDSTAFTNVSSGDPTAQINSDDDIHALAIDANGKIVAAGHTNWVGIDQNSNVSSHHDIAIVRYNADLTFDTSVVTDLFADGVHGDEDESVTSVAIQSDGGIVVGGYADILQGQGVYKWLVARYQPNLSGLDTTFGTTGFVTNDFFSNGQNDMANGLVIQSDGRIVVAGSVHDDLHSYFGLARYNTDGTLDSSFGSGGRAYVNLLFYGSAANAVALQADGHIVAAGVSTDDGMNTQFAAVRYTVDGVLDGSALTDLSAGFESAYGVAVQPDGGVVLTGSARVTDGGGTKDAFATIRYTTLHATKIDPVITWSNPADISWGTALDSTQLNASANVAGTFAYTPASGTVLSAGNAQTLHVDFTPTDSATYNGASKDVSINVLKASPTVGIDNIPNNARLPGSFTATYAYTGDGTPSVTSNTAAVCTASGDIVTFVSAGTCTLVAHATATGNVNAATGSPQSFSIGGSISISNIPANPIYGGSFTPKYAYTGSGKTSTTSSTAAVCSVSRKGSVDFVSPGTCTLTAHATAAGGAPAIDGDPQSFAVGRAAATVSVKNIPKKAKVGSGFIAAFAYVGDGSPSVTSSTATCTVSGGTQVTFVAAGTCTLTAHATAGLKYAAADGSPQSFTIQP